MKYNNYTKFFIITILFLTTIQFSSALNSNDGLITTINDTPFRAVTVASFSKVFFLCVNNACDSDYGINTSIVSYNPNTNEWIRDDNLSTGGTLPMINDLDNEDRAYNNIQAFQGVNVNSGFGGGIQLNYGAYIYVKPSGVFTHDISIYTYDYVTKKWTLRDTITRTNNGFYNGINAPVSAFNIQSSNVYPNSTLIELDTGNTETPIMRTFENKLVDDPNGIGSLTDILLERINNPLIYNSEQNYILSRYFYFTNKIGIVNSTDKKIDIQGENFSTIGTFGVIDPLNDYFYTSDGTSVYKGKISTSLTEIGSPNVYPIDISSQYQDCSNYLGSFTITSIMCAGETNCLIGGYDTSNNSKLVGFNGVLCRTYENSMSEVFNTINNKITDIAIYNQNALTKNYIVTSENGTFFVNNPTTTYPAQCISSTQYCLNPYDIGDGNLGCAVYDLSTCTSCVGNVCTQQCTTENTPNYCQYFGQTRCSDSTTISSCQYNNDGCLNYEVQTELDCNIGEVCVESGNRAYCQEFVSPQTINTSSFIVSPYAISDDTTTYTIDTATKTVGVQTEFAVHTQEFYTSGVNYISRTCDYKEVILNQNVNTIYVNNSYEINLPSPVLQDSIQKISITPSNFGNGSIIIKSQSGTINTYIGYSRNATNKEVCLYFQNGTTIYCDYDIMPTDTLSSIDFEITFKESPRIYTYRVIFNRQYDNRRIVTPQTWIGNDIFTLNVTSDNTTINSNSFVTIPTLNTFTSSINSNTLVSPCSYDNLGTRIVRTYGNINGDPIYSNYYDYNIAVNGLGLTDDELDRTVTGETLTANTKLLVALIVSAVLFFITFLGIISIPNSNVSNGIGGGAIMMIISIITFSVLGWLPVWIMLLIIIFDAGIMALALKKAVVTG